MTEDENDSLRMCARKARVPFVSTRTPTGCVAFIGRENIRLGLAFAEYREGVAFLTRIQATPTGLLPVRAVRTLVRHAPGSAIPVQCGNPPVSERGSRGRRRGAPSGEMAEPFGSMFRLLRMPPLRLPRFHTLWQRVFP